MKAILKNIKTTIFGAFGGLPIIEEGIKTGNWALIVSGIGIFVTGIFAKDNDN